MVNAIHKTLLILGELDGGIVSTNQRRVRSIGFSNGGGGGGGPVEQSSPPRCTKRVPNNGSPVRISSVFNGLYLKANRLIDG
jgi:hypothetical protein